jgi:putative ABC transport system permease protein
MRLLRFLDQVGQDLRFGARSLAASPGFSLLSAASLALGIMATTAMYSVVHAVVLDPFPYQDVDTLMSVRVSEPGRRGGRLYYTVDQFLEIAERNSIFSAVIASTISDVLWTGAGEPQRLRGNHVTTDTFQVMGVPPLLGRWITPADGAPDATPAVVLGYRFWQRQFGGDRSVIGRDLNLNGTVRTVVGVMPRRFMWRGADVYVPVVYQRGKALEGVRGVHVLGRLRPGVTDAQAEADLRPIIEDLQKREPPQFPERWRVGLLSFAETFPSGIRDTLWILFGAVGLLLLIACVNVSHLLLARGAERQKELAVRAALGAARGRLVRQLLTESLILAAAGAAVGVPLAFVGLRAIIALVPPNTIPDESVIAIDVPVLAFTVAVSALTALVFGLVPAWHASRTDLTESLKDAGRSVSGGRRQARLRDGLVMAEVALSVMLLVGAALMIRTVLALQKVDLGIRTDRLLTMRIPLPERRYPDKDRRAAFFRDLLERVSAVPGVQAAALNTGLHPFGNVAVPVEVAGRPPDERPVVVHQVSAAYTSALGIPLRQGSGLTEADVERRQQVALVNEAFVRRYFAGTPELNSGVPPLARSLRDRGAGADALGHILRIPRVKEPPARLADDSFRIAGVVGDTLNRSLRSAVEPEVYIPYSLAGMADRLVVLAREDPAVLTAAVRRQVYAVDPDQPVTDVRTLAAMLDDSVFSGPRFSLALFSVFAALGLALAVVGVYGVVSHGVSGRTREIGIRMAVGAGSATIVRMVLGGGLMRIGAGILLGLVGSAAASRALRQLVWSVSPVDPLSFAVVALVLLTAGLQACLWPALRATCVDPVSALRHE